MSSSFEEMRAGTTNEILVTWDEAGMYHRVWARKQDEDETFLTLILHDGTVLRVAKRTILKIESPAATEG